MFDEMCVRYILSSTGLGGRRAGGGAVKQVRRSGTNLGDREQEVLHIVCEPVAYGPSLLASQLPTHSVTLKDRASGLLFGSRRYIAYDGHIARSAELTAENVQHLMPGAALVDEKLDEFSGISDLFVDLRPMTNIRGPISRNPLHPGETRYRENPVQVDRFTFAVQVTEGPLKPPT